MESEYIKLKPALYIVPTPLGNKDDITLRALKILSYADILACEDTRHTGNLLKQFDIKFKKLESYHDYNEKNKAQYLVNEILSGKSVALVSDAGTPGISDPGFSIVNIAQTANVQIVPLPGPTALIPALIASGFAIHQFAFLGFPPQKKGRKSFLERAVKYDFTTIFYESPHRIEKLIDELILLCGNERKVCIAREISKIYEQYFTGILFKTKSALNKEIPVKGEFVLVLEGLEEMEKRICKENAE
jgi:16S rRNA (cytidine1402-2'-O)-methyltransferase